MSLKEALKIKIASELYDEKYSSMNTEWILEVQNAIDRINKLIDDGEVMGTLNEIQYFPRDQYEEVMDVSTRFEALLIGKREITKNECRHEVYELWLSGVQKWHCRKCSKELKATFEEI